MSYTHNIKLLLFGIFTELTDICIKFFSLLYFDSGIYFIQHTDCLIYIHHLLLFWVNYIIIILTVINSLVY